MFRALFHALVTPSPIPKFPVPKPDSWALGVGSWELTDVGLIEAPAYAAFNAAGRFHSEWAHRHVHGTNGGGTRLYRRKLVVAPARSAVGVRVGPFEFGLVADRSVALERYRSET